MQKHLLALMPSSISLALVRRMEIKDGHSESNPLLYSSDHFAGLHKNTTSDFPY
jgi:hypothetical protein